MGQNDEPGFPRCSRAHENARKKRTSGWALLAGEPFRIFFPAGILVGIYGVSLWPMLYAGWLRFAPQVPHARLMVAGFLGAFVIGFLGTALPRMLTAPRLRAGELSGFLGLYGAAVFCMGTGRVVLGDTLFLALFALFLTAMGIRWIFLRKEHPPAEFVVAVLGLGCAIVGLALQLVGSTTPLNGFWTRSSALLIYQGFTVLPILGIGGFLAPRFLGEGGGPVGQRKPAAVFVSALLILVSVALEALGWPRSADGVRLGVVLVYFGTQTGVFTKTGTRGSMVFALRVSVWSLAASFAFGIIWPQLRIGVEHIGFISGLGLLALTVASRVALGHSGNSAQFFERNRPIKWMIGLALLAMATRVSADFFPKIIVSHHIYGAVLWGMVGTIWLFWLVPKMFVADPDEE